MGRSVAKGSISFGLVHIPVKLFTAAKARDVHFHALHEACGTRLKRPFTCPTCNVPVEKKDTVKGYEYTKGAYVLLTQEDVDSVLLETTKNFHVLGFLEPTDVPVVDVEKNYYLGPDEHAAKPFELFRQALARTGRVALAQVTLWQREHLALIRPANGALLLTFLFYGDEVLDTPEIRESKPVEVPEEELSLAEQLVSTMKVEYRPEEYRDHYRDALLNLIEAKSQGKTVEAKPAPEHPAMDLQAALRATLAGIKKEA